MFAVDICRNILPRRHHGTISTATLLERRLQTEDFGQSGHALSPEDQFIDLCLHFYKEATALHYLESGADLRIMKFLDVALSAAKLTPQLRQLVTERAGAYDVADCVYYALRYAEWLYPEFVPPAFAAGLRPASVEYLDEHGAIDGQPHRWSEPLTDRLFRSDRPTRVAATSTVPHV